MSLIMEDCLQHLLLYLRLQEIGIKVNRINILLTSYDALLPLRKIAYPCMFNQTDYYEHPNN